MIYALPLILRELLCLRLFMGIKISYCLLYTSLFDWQLLINEVKAYQLESPATVKLPKLSPTEMEMCIRDSHPSGARKPSGADDRLTEAVKKAAGTLDIRLSVHVIVAGNNYYSYADEGKL